MKRSLRSTSDRQYDVFKNEWVYGDEEGLVDGLPIVTHKVARLLRTYSPKQAVEQLGIPLETATLWVKKAKEVFLELFDSRAKYKKLHVSNFEDEAELESHAVQHSDLNLPPDAFARYMSVHAKRVMQNGEQQCILTNHRHCCNR